MEAYKYIVFEATGDNGLRYAIPVMFPKFINHDEACKHMRMALRSSDNGFTPGMPISAGFCSIENGEIFCGGKSETLNLKSRGKEDQKVFREYNIYGRSMILDPLDD